MKLLRMTATFGSLENRTLELRPGLNILSSPNESGKSTWAAFLLAMFYGVDTSERRSRGLLPIKEKYRPWSGKPMSGRIELEWNGRNITIERSTEGRIPLGRFSAYDTDTGAAIPELTAESCGRLLLGAEQSVFARSAFIGQSAMAVTADAGLERRLHSLVTTGEESVSYADTESTLRTWKNHVRHNQTGYLPETETALSSVTGKLAQIRITHRDDLQLLESRTRLEKRQAELLRIEDSLRQSDCAARFARLHQAEKAAEDAKRAEMRAEQDAAPLPSPEQLRELSRSLDRQDAAEAVLRTRPEPAAPRRPDPPAPLRGLDADDARRRGAEDADRVQTLQTPKKQSPVLFLLAAALLLTAAAVFFLLPKKLYFLIPALLSLAALIWAILRRKNTKKQNEARLAEANALCGSYLVGSADALRQQSGDYADALIYYQQDLRAYEHTLQERQTETDRLRAEGEALLTPVRAFASDIYTRTDARRAIENAAEAHQSLAAAVQNRRYAEQSLAAAQADTAGLSELPPPEKNYIGLYTAEAVRSELEQTRETLRRLNKTLLLHQGEVAALGDPAELEARLQLLTERRDALNRRNDALTLALDTLKNVHTELQSRFSPQIAGQAGKLLAEMTDSRYDTLRMQEDFSLSARESGGDVLHSLTQLSGGTADQIYLALRLAICRLALCQDAPLVLDDALVYFDDVRLAAVLRMLRREAQTRQILLFTCQTREQNLLEKEDNTDGSETLS